GGVAHIIVGGPQQVAGVALLHELGDHSSRHEWNIIGVRLNRQQHLALVRRPFGRAFEKHVAGRLLRPRLLCVQEGGTATTQARRKEVATGWAVSAWLHKLSPWCSMPDAVGSVQDSSSAPIP